MGTRDAARRWAAVRSLCCVRRAACIVGFVLYEKNVHQPWPLALKCASRTVATQSAQKV